jgi:hypothetical protein
LMGAKPAFNYNNIGLDAVRFVLSAQNAASPEPGPAMQNGAGLDSAQ